ncbi:Telomerase reverse transcriptase [Camellia lanceoleosa]|uniref:Telomerase reverse transcriptase n=1 Tax=Camellia lanceoleosa TaxID=1840588 RepID=A0ACC0GI20_9ERIC|nr:Telomerase reverse transcriptase [Camellia lanceoleosa]
MEAILQPRSHSYRYHHLLIPPSPPPPPPKCRCKGWQCFGCSGEGTMSFLLKLDDPSNYHKLLTHCVIVVSDNAPHLLTFQPDCCFQGEVPLYLYSLALSFGSPSTA